VRSVALCLAALGCVAAAHGAEQLAPMQEFRARIEGVAASPAQLQVGAALAMQGRGAVPACDDCHAARSAVDTPPLLAAQPAQYLHTQLVRYAAGTRSDARMSAIARALGDAQLRAVSAYYAGLVLQAAAAPRGGANVTRGRRIALEGAGSQPVPACIKCHGQRGEGVAPHVPRLAGQREQYLVRELESWRMQQRSGDTDGVMAAVAQRMNAADVAAVAAYYAAAPVVEH
jgi:cytochrome c553